MTPSSLLRLIIVIVNSRFLERPQERSRRNQLIHRRLTKTKSIGCGQYPESQVGRQSDGYGGWCLEFRRGGREVIVIILHAGAPIPHHFSQLVQAHPRPRQNLIHPPFPRLSPPPPPPPPLLSTC